MKTALVVIVLVIAALVVGIALNLGWVRGPMPPESADSGDGEEVICTTEYDPVCGVDGKTYSNRCVAEQQKGIAIAHTGPCPKPDIPGVKEP